MKLQLTAPCLFGLESVLSSEIRRIGGEDIRVSDGRVVFTGDESVLARANICLRTAERVQILLAEFDAYCFEDLFQGVKKIPLEDYVGKHDAFPVKGHSIKSKLHSIPDCQKIIKRAMVDRLAAVYGISWFEETGATFQIEFLIHKDHCLIMMDTSGAGLHKRGYRQNSVIAPIKETLAAGIIDIARVYPDSTLYDPFCGSGTMLIEGAMHAMKIAPGLRRRFAAEKWDFIPEKIWQEERQRAFDLIDRKATFEAYGSDIDPEAVELTKANAQKAGVGSKIHVKQADVKDFAMNEGKGVLICNPPYGERLLDEKEARQIYRTMGKVFVPREKDRFYIISPDEKFETYFGRIADKRRKLYNGMIQCQVFQYFK